MRAGGQKSEVYQAVACNCAGVMKKPEHRKWGCSSAGRAPALQAGGQEFDPPHLHQIFRILHVFASLRTSVRDGRSKRTTYEKLPHCKPY